MFDTAKFSPKRPPSCSRRNWPQSAQFCAAAAQVASHCRSVAPCRRRKALIVARILWVSMLRGDASRCSSSAPTGIERQVTGSEQQQGSYVPGERYPEGRGEKSDHALSMDELVGRMSKQYWLSVMRQWVMGRERCEERGRGCCVHLRHHKASDIKASDVRR